MRRLPPPPGTNPFVNEIQPDLHPAEILFDVRKLIDDKNVCVAHPRLGAGWLPSQEEALSSAFNKVIEALGLYDHWLDSQSAVPNDDHQWAQHAVQSIIWSEAGK